MSIRKKGYVLILYWVCNFMPPLILSTRVLRAFAEVESPKLYNRNQMKLTKMKYGKYLASTKMCSNVVWYKSGSSPSRSRKTEACAEYTSSKVSVSKEAGFCLPALSSRREAWIYNTSVHWKKAKTETYCGGNEGNEGNRCFIPLGTIPVNQSVTK